MPENNKKQEIKDEKILVAKAKKGDRAAFEDLVRMFSKYVYTTAFFILRDSHEAEDVSQEVFVKVYLSIKGFRGLSSFKTWIRKLTVNTCIDRLRLRSKFRDKKVSLEKITGEYEVVFEGAGGPSLEKNFFHQEAVRDVLRIVVQMEENYRLPLILRDFQDYSYREIAELTGKPIGTVKTNIHRARRIIKEKLKTYK
ncbi:MAG: RNA polymerase sigma factor [Actinobacteria bacterium]|nr:RNA polymerase sigma factor [Actinomycetota bacterium]